MRGTWTLAILLASCTWLALPGDAEARGRFRHRHAGSCGMSASPGGGGCAGGVCAAGPQQPQAADHVVQEAMAQVNALRAARGLPPYQLCPGLQEAAASAATYRARYRISGHCANDFIFVPAGYSAGTAGCAAWPAGSGFGACAIYERRAFAGAATVRGADGIEYHHIYIR